MKFMLFMSALFIAIQAFAFEGTELRLDRSLTEDEGAALVQDAFEAGRYVLQSPVFIVKSAEKSAQYPAGDFVMLWGVGANDTDQGITADEYKRIWRIMNYLSSRGFRVVMNVRADGADVKDAVETEGTSVILYSGHGNQSGFYDFNSVRVSYDVFKNKAKSLYQFILSACYGTEARAKYNPPSDLVMFTWSGLTNSDDLESFLMGSWTGFEGKR